jgi:integrase
MDIHFIPCEKNKPKTSLRIFIFHRGNEYRLPAGETIVTKFWNFDKNRCKLVREYAEAGFINQRLDRYEKALRDIINDYGLVTPTQERLRADFKNYKNGININAGGVSYNEQEQYLVDFIKSYKEDCNRKKGTRIHYDTTIAKLEKYEQRYRTKLRFFDIDIQFYNRFKKYISGQTYTKNGREYHYSKNYVGSIFKDIKSFMRKARNAKLHNFNDFENIDFVAEKEETDAIYLNMEEIMKIYNLNFTPEFLIAQGYDSRTPQIKSAIGSLNEERDRFLIGCFTALRHSDYSRIDILNFQNDMVSIWTKKRDKKVFIPIHYLLREIMKRRENILPKPISEQKHNKRIKEIGKLAGIDHEVMLSKTRGESRVSEVFKKYECITTHTARRSGASNMYLSGIDLKFIQDILGHSTAEQTLKYIKVAAEDNARRLQSHPYFTGS